MFKKNLKTKDVFLCQAQSHLDCRSKENILQADKSCARKEIVEIHILLTSRKGDRKNMKSIEKQMALHRE